MKRIITPAIFLSASIVAGGAPTTLGTDELADENAQDIGVERSGAFQRYPMLTRVDGLYHESAV